LLVLILPNHTDHGSAVQSLDEVVPAGTLMISPEVAGSTRPLVLVVVLTWVVALLVIGRRVRAPKSE
jgi:hypothetical protein